MFKIAERRAEINQPTRMMTPWGTAREKAIGITKAGDGKEGSHIMVILDEMEP